MIELNKGNEEQLAKLTQAAEKYNLLSDAALERKLQELQDAISTIQEEQVRRKSEAAKQAWADVIDAITNYCNKYGAITVEGDYDYETVSLDITSGMNSSCIGLIEMS